MKTLSGIQKAALLLRSLPPQVVEEVLARAGAERAARLRAELGRTAGTAQAEALRGLLREIDAALSRPQHAPPAPVPGATLNAVVGGDGPVSDVRAELAVVAPEHLARALVGEQSRTAALVLNLLDQGRAGEVYRRLPPELRREASVQFASQAMPAAEITRRIVRAVLVKAKHLAEATAGDDPADRARRLAELFRQLDQAERRDLLAALAERDPDSARAVKEQLYRFDDLPRFANASVQKVLGEVDTRTLAQALKGAPDAVTEKVFANLSQRAKDTLKDEIELLNEPPPAQVELARKAVADAVQRLDERGELALAG